MQVIHTTPHRQWAPGALAALTQQPWGQQMWWLRQRHGDLKTEPEAESSPRLARCVSVSASETAPRPAGSSCLERRAFDGYHVMSQPTAAGLPLSWPRPRRLLWGVVCGAG